MANTIPERAHAMLGIDGRMLPISIRDAERGTFRAQEWKATREYRENGERFRITVTLRYADQCGNGHNTFSVTGEIDEYDGDHWRDHSCGCIHDDIAKQFPKLAHLPKWHGCTSNGPLHYEANTVYLAGDRDYRGLRNGERKRVVDRNGTPGWELLRPDRAAENFLYSAECPRAPEAPRYVPWNHVGEGKARELDEARSVAIWPEATDAELCAEPDELRAALRARLPKLMQDFRADLEAAGFMWEARP